MALIMTMSEVVGVLAAIAMLLWVSAFIEARHLGPVVPATIDVDNRSSREGLDTQLV